jgi:hypothetical protein
MSARRRPDPGSAQNPKLALPWLKVVTVRYGIGEHRDAAQDRHFAAHPEDRDAEVVIFQNSR